MARIRTIKPEFPQSESMGRVSRDARLLFVMLWTLADDSGRLRGNSRMLASLLFPYDDDAKNLIDGWLRELSTERCVGLYSIGGDSYLEILNWCKHQKIDKPSQSKIQPFDESSRILSNPLEQSSEDQGSRIKDLRTEGPEDHTPLPPKGGRRQKSAKQIQKDSLGNPVPVELLEAVGEIVQSCPGEDRDGRKIRVVRGDLLTRIMDIQENHSAITLKILVQSWLDYLGSQPAHIKAPQYFFGKAEDQGPNAANWLPFARAVYVRMQLSKEIPA
ncbi:MAG: hypothetical protein ABFD89_10015 [Bryobacteraceae bacterium]